MSTMQSHVSPESAAAGTVMAANAASAQTTARQLPQARQSSKLSQLPSSSIYYPMSLLPNKYGRKQLLNM